MSTNWLNSFYLKKSVCSSLILISCFYYTFYIFVNRYNCNVLLMGLVPVVTYYFYKSIRDEKTEDWIIFGTVSALAFLGKYQIVFLFVVMFLYLLLFERKQFKKDFQIITEEYHYKVCNKFNKCREKMFYYTIIPPQNLR